MFKRAIIYARVSTDEQTKGYSLQTQIDACKNYAIERGYRLLEVFSEDYSGATIDRPKLNAVRDFISKEPTDVIIVYDVDRLARKSVYQALIEEEFLKAGASVEYVIGQYDNSDEGRLQKQIRASIAEYEKAKILERSKRGKRGKAQSGFVLVGARPPYGYQAVSEPHKARLEIEEEEAIVVRNVFAWYLRGDGAIGPMSMNAIAHKLTELKVPTRGDKQAHFHKKYEKGTWSPEMIRHILKNETYTGTWHYGKTKMIEDGKVRKAKPKCGFGKQVMRPKEEWIGVPVPVIIDKETFDLTQARMIINQEQAARGNKHQYLMTKRIRCLNCGFTFQGRTRNNRYYYYCKGTERKPIKRCNAPTFHGPSLDNIVWSWITSLIKDPETIMVGLQSAQDSQSQHNQTLVDRLGLIEQQLGDNQTQLKKLLDLCLTGDFAREILTERRTRLEENIANLNKEHADISKLLQQVVVSEGQMDEIKKFCETIREKVDIATFEQKRQLFEMLNVRGKLSIENGEKVVYVECLIAPQQRLLLAPTSHSSNTGATGIMPCVCPSMVRSR